MTITLKNVGVRYGAHVAVEGVSLAAERGRVLALVGPNGSGKTSLLKAIAGHGTHTGQIAHDGAIPLRIAYMPQNTAAAGSLTVIETVLLGRLRSLALRVSNDDLDAVAEQLSALGLLPLADRLIGTLSGGQRQLVFLAQALVGSPECLLLDEPTSALDLRHQLDVLDLMRRATIDRSLVTVVVLHDLNAAIRYADAVAVLSQGRIATVGQPAMAITPALVASVFGVRAESIPLSDGRPHLVATQSLKSEVAPP